MAETKVYLLKNKGDNALVAKALIAHGIVEKVPSRKPNHIFLRIVKPGRIVWADTMWWAFHIPESDEYVFLGLDPYANPELQEPVIHGRVGGSRPTDGFVKHWAVFNLIRRSEIEGAFREGWLSPINGMLIVEFLDIDRVGPIYSILEEQAQGFRQSWEELVNQLENPS